MCSWNQFLLMNSLLFHHSDPDLINMEDHDSHTPILTAAARSKVKAFWCLMSYQQHLKENPVFKALESKENPVAILKVHECLVPRKLQSELLSWFPLQMVS